MAHRSAKARQLHHEAAPHRDAGKAFALVIVLLVLAMLVAATSTFVYAVSWRCLAVNGQTEMIQNQYIVDAAVETLLSEWTSGDLRQRLLERGRVAGSFGVGDHLVEFRLWDEAAKLHVVKAPDGQQAALTLVGDGGELQLRPQTLHAASLAESSQLFEDVFIVPDDELDRFYGTMHTDQWAVIDTLTLWGDGRVNLFIAPEQVLRARFGDQGSVMIESLLEARRYSRDTDLGRLIGRMGVSGMDQRAAETRLVGDARTVTLRIVCHGPRMSTSAFGVLDVSDTGPRLVLWRQLPALVDAERPLAEESHAALRHPVGTIVYQEETP